MKFLNLSKIMGAGLLALSLTLAPLALPSVAQTQAPVEDIEDDDDGADWGWLGLLGLIGLAGLVGKNRDRRPEQTAYRDPDVSSRTGYRE